MLYKIATAATAETLKNIEQISTSIARYEFLV